MILRRVVFPEPEAPIIKHVSPGIAKPVKPFKIYLSSFYSNFAFYVFILGNDTEYDKFMKEILIAFSPLKMSISYSDLEETKE